MFYFISRNGLLHFHRFKLTGFTAIICLTRIEEIRHARRYLVRCGLSFCYIGKKRLEHMAEEAFFHAYMTEGLAIGEREVVEEIASRIGLDNAEVEYVLDSDELTDFVRHDEKIAREQLNITGVPFFVFDQKLTLSGAQPREIFLQALQQAQSAIIEIEQDDAAQCNDESCEIKPQ